MNSKNYGSPVPRVLLSLKYRRGQESRAIALEQPPIDGKPENWDHEVQQRMYLRACWRFVMPHGWCLTPPPPPSLTALKKSVSINIRRSNALGILMQGTISPMLMPQNFKIIMQSVEMKQSKQTIKKWSFNSDWGLFSVFSLPHLFGSWLRRPLWRRDWSPAVSP